MDLSCMVVHGRPLPQHFFWRDFFNTFHDGFAECAVEVQGAGRLLAQKKEPLYTLSRKPCFTLILYNVNMLTYGNFTHKFEVTTATWNLVWFTFKLRDRGDVITAPCYLSEVQVSDRLEVDSQF